MTTSFAREPRHLPAPVRIAALTVLVALGTSVAIFLATFLECVAKGPYTSWFNRHHRELLLRHGLVGRPDAEVERVLGSATRVRERPFSGIVDADGNVSVRGGRSRRFTYAPYPWLPFGLFQVDSENSLVTAFELFDD